MVKSFSDDVDFIKIVFVVGGVLWSFGTVLFTFNSYAGGSWKPLTENLFLVVGIIISFILIFIIMGIWKELEVPLRKVTVTDDGTVSIPGRGRLSQSVDDLFSGLFKISRKNGYYYAENKERRDKNRVYLDFAKDNILEARLAMANEIMPIDNRLLGQKYVTNPKNAVLIKFKNPIPYIGSGRWEGLDSKMTDKFPDFAKQLRENLVPEKPIEAVFVSVKEPHKLIEELEK